VDGGKRHQDPLEGVLEELESTMSIFHDLNCIMPPHILDRLAESDDSRVRDAARRTLVTSAQLRGARSAGPVIAGDLATPAHGRRTIFDAEHRESLAAGELVRTEEAPPVADVAVNQAFDGLGWTRQFYAEILGRDSIDGAGMRLDGYVHYGEEFNNAFWDGRRMVFGDGDRVLFTDFTGSLDVIGHELSHGVTQMTAGLVYHNQQGALNESMSDVFGSLIKQWSLGQSADDADWLIGAEIFTPSHAGDALRSMKNPGTAYDNRTMGKDPQPAHMRDFMVLPDTARGDNGGVHINSGIPNRAFYLTAANIGGQAWRAPGHIWYESLKASNRTTDFQQFADTTGVKAAQLYGNDARQAVVDAWGQVGITPADTRAGGVEAFQASAGTGRSGQRTT
jgi:Zn-dependent metalloprotease